jgi:hypothetical protein
VAQRVLVTGGAGGTGLAITLAVFLAAPHGPSISGQMLPIDGDSKSAQ